MKQLLLVFAVVALVGCGESAEEKAAKAKAKAAKAKAAAAAEAKAEVKTTAEEERSDKSLIADPIVEKAIRKQINKPTGELTKADLADLARIDGLY